MHEQMMFPQLLDLTKIMHVSMKQHFGLGRGTKTEGQADSMSWIFNRVLIEKLETNWIENAKIPWPLRGEI